MIGLLVLLFDGLFRPRRGARMIAEMVDQFLDPFYGDEP